MNRPTERQRRILRAAAIPAALLASALVVWQGSYAAFSTTTDSPSNNWASGTVALQNDSNGGAFAVSGAAAFNVANIKPGDTGSYCINVKNTGSLDATAASPIKFFGTGPVLSTNVLAQNLTFSVVESSTAVTAGAACTGFAAGTTVFNATMSTLGQTYATGSGAITLVAAATKGYKISWTMPAAAPSTAAGQTLTNVGLTWGLTI